MEKNNNEKIDIIRMLTVNLSPFSINSFFMVALATARFYKIHRAPDKVRISVSKIPISSPMSMFDYLL